MPSLPKNKLVPLIVASVVLVALLIGGVFWWQNKQRWEATENAYVQADTVVVSPQVTGYVAEVLVVDNQRVAPGQELVRLDPSEAQAAFLQAQANVAAAEAAVQNVDDRARLGQAQIAQAAAGVSSAQAQAQVASADMERSIVDGTRTVLRAAERAGGPRVVYVSSISAINGAEEPILFDEQSPCTLPLDDPAFVFVKTKRSAEDLCREAAGRGLPAVIVNPCETFAPWDTGLITSRNLINWWKMPLVTVTAGGVCVGHGEDVARGITAALTRGRPGERYILGGENITVQQMAERFFEALGERRSVLVVPTALARGFTRFAQTVGLPLPYTPQIIPFASRWWYMNSQKAQTELGVRFRGAAEAIAPTARWLRDGGWLR